MPSLILFMMAILFLGSNNISAGIASHFQTLTDKDFDDDHFTQVEFDVLIIKESCRKVTGFLEHVKITSKGVVGIIMSL